MKRKSFPSTEVWDALEKLHRNDLIRIFWHDACSFDRVHALTPELYVTSLPRTGYFYDVKEDPETGMPYLIMSQEVVAGDLVPSEGDSIPIPEITGVEILVPLTGKTPEKTVHKVMKTEGIHHKVIDHVVKIGG